ncbi:MAG: hypothetical protein SOT41_03570 [Candidatus Faecisoma sp.]|nr:hypothetical protein [Candidatus Faecisoma sp.]
MKKKIIILIILILISILTLIGSSYALLTKKFTSKKLSVEVGTLKVDFTEGNAITMDNVVPMTDENGMNTTPYTFTITNSGTIDSYYTISNEEDSNNTLDTTYLKYKLVSNDGYDSGIKRLKDIGTGTYRIVDERALLKSKSVTYKLYLWIASDAGNDIQNKIYKSKIIVNSTSNRVGDTYCLDNGFNKLSDCMLVMNNHEKTTDIAKTNIKAKGTPDFSKTATTDEGLFMAEDDEGESYYYRGAVRNNYVSFAGFLWRIIRRNGDGSVRMIYSGKSASDTGADITIGKSAYNEKYWDPTYVGYKYNEDFSLHESNRVIDYNWFFNTQKYNFGTSYTLDESTKKFTLTGDIKQLTWNDNHDEIVNNQLYSCLHTSCNVVYKVTGYNNANAMKVQPISYSSNSLLSAQTNQTDSLIKTKLDNWYKEKLINYSSYLSDETFCNDRSIASGTGYKVDSPTYYGAYDRLANKRTPSLKCSQENDRFRVSSTSAKLDYPVGLILADEVSLAGGISGKMNANYYLYSGRTYHSFTPSKFINEHTYGYIVNISSDGGIGMGNHLTDNYYIRPVINLKKDVTISKGDGSSLNPFTIN